MNNELVTLSLASQKEKLKKGEISATDLINATLRQIEGQDGKIGAYLAVSSEQALAEAAKLDEAGYEESKPLWGIPIAVKDALSTKDIPTTAASRILENFVPIYDAFAVRKLKEAGAIIIGKTNLDEFAMGSTTENSAFKKTANPWDLTRVPGGSSGGSAAAVAAYECSAALGSDTGGSIRQPAAFCGCVGLKPTYGRVSRYGLFAYASSLDQVGPMARTVEDCALLLQVIAGFDQRDNTSSPRPVPDYLNNARKDLKSLKIGYCPEFFNSGLDADTSEQLIDLKKILEAAGAQLLELTLPAADMAIAAYYIIAMAEASSNLARYDGVRYGRRAAGVSTLEDLYVLSRTQGFGPEVKRRIMLGSYILSSGFYDAYFRKAALARRLIYNQYLAQFEKCDFILMPVSPVVAWKMNENVNDPLKTYLMDAFTVPVNLAGLPAITLPIGIGKVTGMPIGIQLVGKPFDERDLLAAASAMAAQLPPLPPPACL